MFIYLFMTLVSELIVEYNISINKAVATVW